MSGWLGVVVAFASAIVGGIVGWFGHSAWSQRNSVKGDHNVVANTGAGDVTQIGRDQVTHHHSAPLGTPPWINVELRRAARNTSKVVLVNQSKDRAATGVRWQFG